MADLKTRFTLDDQMSAQLSSMADFAERYADSLERAGASGDVAIGSIASSATGVAESMSSAAEAVGHWTEAIGNLDKSAMEAVYSTQELVEAGYKTEDAIEGLEEALSSCESAAAALSDEMETSAGVFEELSSAQESASSSLEALTNSENLSVETKQELANAAQEAMNALNDFHSAQQDAEAAMEEYDAVLMSGTNDLNELAGAEERARSAAEALSEARREAVKATEEYNEAVEKASEQSEESGTKGIEAIESISAALAFAGIAKAVSDITDEVYELATAFSEAESTVVKATGATGESLSQLDESMMNAYASSKSGSLDDAAAVVGELNTRLGYTGDILTETTGLYLDFAEATGGNAASSVRSVTQLMNQWNVTSSETNLILDKLTYAGQASGISVENLSSQLVSNKAILDQLGFSLDQSIAMLMKFELAGTNTSQVMTGLRTALASGAISSLDELYSVFDRISQGAMTAAEASEMFGKRAGPAIVNAVNSGVFSIDDFVASLEGAEGALSTTAEAAQTLDQKWEQANKNFSSAFSKQLTPAVTEFSEHIAGIKNSAGDFLNEHTKVTSAIIVAGASIGAIVVGITGLTAAVAGLTAAATVAQPAITALGTAFTTAMGPLGLAAIVATGIVAGITALAAVTENTVDVSNELTSSSSKLADVIENLKAEYDEVVEIYGANSEAAGKLSLRIYELEEEYNRSAKTIGEFREEISSLGEELDNAAQTYEDNISSIDDTFNSSNELVSMLAVLTSQTDTTGSSLTVLNDIVDNLNGSYENLGLTVDKTTGALNYSIPELYEYVNNKAEEDRKNAASEGLTNAVSKFGETRKQYQEARSNAGAAWDSYQWKEDQWIKEHPIKATIGKGAETSWSSELGTAFKSWQAQADISSQAGDNYNNLTASIKNYYTELGHSEEEAEQFIQGLEDAADAANEFSDGIGQITTAEGAVYSALEGVQGELTGLAQKYKEAYDAAYESFSGQFGLFDVAQADAQTTIASTEAALQSQLNYWNGYADSINTIKSYTYEQLGVEQAQFDTFMAYLQDGSAEAVALSGEIATALKNGNTQAVTDLINLKTQVDTACGEASGAVADWQTGFSEQMKGIVDTMDQTVDALDLSAEATTAAKSTIQSYANSILDGKRSAVTAVNEVIAAVKAAMRNAPTTVRVPSAVSVTSTGGSTSGNAMSAVIGTAAYASGTLDASPGLALVGEEGPELINFGGGEAVYTADETERIIRAFNDRSYGDTYNSYSNEYIASLPVRNDDGGRNNAPASSEKKIVLEINGNGRLDVPAGTDKSQIVDIMSEMIVPLIKEKLLQEIFEEGDDSYDY